MMNDAQIIIPKPSYFAKSSRWYIDEQKEDEENVLCKSAIENVSTGRIKFCAVEKLKELPIVFIDGSRKVEPIEDEVYVQNPYNHAQYFTAGCSLNKLQTIRYDYYKLFLQRLGAKRIYKKVDTIDVNSRKTKIDVGMGAGKSEEKEPSSSSTTGGVNFSYSKELNEALREDFWEDYTFERNESSDLYSVESWRKAKDFLDENNLQYDEDFTTLLAQRNPDNGNLLRTIKTHYHSKRDCSSIMDLSVEIDVAKVAFGFNPATKVINKFLKLSFDLDFHCRTEMSRIMEQSIDVMVEF